MVDGKICPRNGWGENRGARQESSISQCKRKRAARVLGRKRERLAVTSRLLSAYGSESADPYPRLPYGSPMWRRTVSVPGLNTELERRAASAPMRPRRHRIILFIMRTPLCFTRKRSPPTQLPLHTHRTYLASPFSPNVSPLLFPLANNRAL